LKKNLVGSILRPLGVFIFFSLASCVTNSQRSPFAPVYVTDRAKYTLLSPSDIETELDMPQQIAGTYGTGEFIMEAWVKADAGGINIALFNSFGTELGYLSFGEGEISFDTSVFPPAMKPEYIIADFQFCFYRADALSAALGKAGLVFVEEKSGDPGSGSIVRRITAGKKQIAEITKDKDTIRYTNFLRGYTFIIRGAF
jgi:hypothetical protein